MLARNTSNKEIVASQLEMADGIFSRMVGLMGRKNFPPGSGLWIKRSGNSIHTFFMHFPIDLIFIDQKGKVRSIKKSVEPWKMVFVPVMENLDCLELPSGSADQSRTQVGDMIHVET